MFSIFVYFYLIIRHLGTFSKTRLIHRIRPVFVGQRDIIRKSAIDFTSLLSPVKYHYKPFNLEIGYYLSH